MGRKPNTELRRGWTTGACAAAAAKAACQMLLSGEILEHVQITLPGGEQPRFSVLTPELGDSWARAAIEKDAGDDPDVTHGALIVVTLRPADQLRFAAGDGVGMITKAGLPIPVGEPAINPKPREMIEAMLTEACAPHGASPHFEVEVSVPGGQELALKTWNPRLGIEGGISILGTTGIVRPFSCAAWIASIHRGIDVARADGLEHVAGCTGATSEKVVQGLYGLPDHAMLDMGDFAGGLLKYLARHPVPRITIGGGIGKMTKLAQGASDLHSGRSQVDFAGLADTLGVPGLKDANTALEAVSLAPEMAEWVAQTAKQSAASFVAKAGIEVDTVIIDRGGEVLARA
ncbi:MAG: cobalt-precorrin-5B (C(1))-methyltransferase [Rhodobacteraceae bacterium]|nr:cobalt-precorrin-5B (C(1))-methyltransferase [Paracoccaceae bacterium]